MFQRMPAPHQFGKAAPFWGLGGTYNLWQISAKEAGKTALQRGIKNCPYGLRQLVQTAAKLAEATNTATKSAKATNTATKSAKATNTATKSAQAASTSRGGQCEQPSHVHGVRLGLMRGKKKVRQGKGLLWPIEKVMLDYWVEYIHVSRRLFR